MPNLDESNRIEHHAEKNKMQKLLPIGMDRSIIAIGTMWLLNICQALLNICQFRSTASAFSFNFQQSSTVPFKQKTDRTRNIKAPSDRVR